MVFFAYMIIRKMTRILVKKVLTSILVICIIVVDKESCQYDNDNCQISEYFVLKRSNNRVLQQKNREEMIICHLKII